MIANPDDNPELFEEGWAAALAKEQGRDVEEDGADPNEPADGEDEQKEDDA